MGQEKEFESFCEKSWSDGQRQGNEGTASAFWEPLQISSSIK